MSRERVVLPRKAKAVLGRCLGLAGVFISLVMAAGCQNGEKKKGEDKPLDVQVSTPIEDTGVTDYEEFIGQLDAKLTVKIQARVKGYLEKINFKEGDRVEKGQILFEIDSKPYLAELGKAKAGVKLAKAHRETMLNVYQRAHELYYKKKSLSKDEYDTAKGQYDESEATVEQSIEQERAAQLNVDYCTIKAPFTGIISRKFVDEGNDVQADSTVLSTLVTEDPVYVYFNLDERSWLKIQRLFQQCKSSADGKYKTPQDVAKTVLLWLGDQDKTKDKPFKGELAFVDNKLDPGTGTLLVRGVFHDPTGLLTPGLFANIRLPIGEPHDALLISERALGTDQGEKFVWVVNSQNKVEDRRVKVGSMHKGMRILEPAVKKDGKVVEGLLPGEKVVVSGVQKVRKDQLVNPKLVPMPVGGSDHNSLTIGAAPEAGKKTGADKSHGAHH
jgi:RND family efflux transporter MFP subunit